MFCPQCGAQSEQHTKFCRSCGLKLSDHAQLLPRPPEVETQDLSPEEARRAQGLLKSTEASAIGSILLPINLALAVEAFVMAVSPGPREALIPVVGLIALLSCIHFCLGGLGFLQLVRSGFFRTFKPRLIRAAAGLIGQSNRQPDHRPEPTPETERIFSHLNAASVTEDTTHQLQRSLEKSGELFENGEGRR
ncbi:MAG TPA: zinc ribbon domain-containing protein [Blastocatellia bacterium]|nr:zinc ribbon domain-containing protein [Blastocatellia bacterium]